MFLFLCWLVCVKLRAYDTMFGYERKYRKDLSWAGATFEFTYINYDSLRGVCTSLMVQIVRNRETKTVVRILFKICISD